MLSAFLENGNGLNRGALENYNLAMKFHLSCELCSMSRGSLDGRGVWGKMDTCIRMAGSLCCPPETMTTLSIGYNPLQNKTFK